MRRTTWLVVVVDVVVVVGGGEMVEGESVISMNPVPEKMDGKSLLVRQKT